MNMECYTERLLRLIEGSLDPESEAALRSEMADSPVLQEEFESLRDMRGMLQGTMNMSSDDALKPFFTDRLMRKVEPENQARLEQDDLAFFLSRLFRPIALAGCVIALSLAAYNLNVSGTYTSETSAAEALLALPPVNTISVYDLDLYVGDDPTTTSSLP